MKNKIVYIGLSADVLHHGHINLINHAKKYGRVIVGLLSDNAISTKKRIPLLNFSQRKKIIENINGVSKVVVQNEWDYTKNIIKIKPNYMVHGDDWIFGNEKKLRIETIKALKKVGGKLIEIPHTKNISSHSLKERMYLESTLPSNRQAILKRVLGAKKISRFLEAHSPLSAIIAEQVYYKNKQGKK